MLTPHQADMWHQKDRPSIVPMLDEDWPWDPALRWLTFPQYPSEHIGPDDQNICPLRTKGEQWIGVVVNRWQVIETQLPVGLLTDERSNG
jgi:hypothetical protein